MKKHLFVLLLLFCAALGFGSAVDVKIDASYQQEIQKWRDERVTRLKSDTGWLTVVGLFWLKEGENKFGTDPSNDVVFPKDKAPASAGSFFLEKGQVRMVVKEETGAIIDGKPAGEIVMQPDVTGKPTTVTVGSLSFYVIKRGDKLGIRLKDSESDVRRNFKGINYFPVDSKWRFEATWIPFNPPKKIPIANIIGQIDDEDCKGAVEFAIGGKTYRINALLEDDDKTLFLIFGDQTNGKETYGAGRFLYADAPNDKGKVIVDFNKSENPPCAFTPFATCPLPPKENKLALTIDAGEKKYH